MLDSEIKKMWKGHLVTIPAQSLSSYSLSTKTISFLTDVGLPKNCPLLITFFEEKEFLEPLTYHGQEYLIIGNDYGTKLCLRLQAEDVWSIDPTDELPTRFINSNLRNFLIFIQIYLSQEESLKVASDKEALNIVRHLRSQFGEVDSPALQDPEAWWSVILEQIEQGTM